MRVLRVPALFLLVLFCLLSAGCESREAETRHEAGSPPDEIRFDCPAPFGSLTRVEPGKAGSSFVIPFLYSFLVEPSETGEAKPDLARSWTSVDDDKVWTIRIRTDALFHDQTPVTASDVMASIATGLKENDPAVFGLITDLRTVSKDSVKITLKKTEPQFSRSIWRIPIMPASGRGNPSMPIGSGPYRFGSRQGETMVELRANDRYYGGKPPIGTLRFHYEPDRESSWARLLAGKTDVVQEIPPRDYRIIRRLRDRFHFRESILDYCQVLLFNTTRPPFSDPRVRLAVSSAIDRWSLVEQVLGGAAVVAVGPMGVNSPFRNPRLEPVPHAPRKSVEILDDLGWRTDPTGRFLVRDGKPFEITILLFEGAELDRRVAEFVQLCLNDVGILARLEPLPADLLIQRYLSNTDFDAVLTEFRTGGNNPEFIARLWSRGDGTEAQAGGFNDPDVNRLFAEALTEGDPARRARLFQRLDAHIAGLHPGAFLFHRMAFDAMSNRVKLDVPFSIDFPGLLRLRNANLSRPESGKSPLSGLFD